MNILYILQNQDGYFLGNKGLPGRGSSKSGVTKDHEWVDGREAGAIFRTEHKDEAINMRVEVNSQDIYSRITIKEVESTTKRHPIIPAEDLPPPLPKHTPEELAECESNGQTDLLSSTESAIETSINSTINSSLEGSDNDSITESQEPVISTQHNE